MWLTRSMAGSAPGGLVWDKPGAVVEVPDDLALELLAIRDAGFAEVAAPDGGAEPKQPEAPATDAEDSQTEAEQQAPKRATRARKTQVAE